ncbi:MAG: hypothetical protein ACKVW3_04840 [Phycisphaerales bacterium]
MPVSTRWRSILAFGLPPTTLLVASGIAGSPALASRPDAPLVAAAAALDLTLTVPALVCFLLVRARRAPWIILVPTFILGYTIARALLPATQTSFLDTIGLLIFPAEAIVIAWLVGQAIRGFSGGAEGDLYDRLNAAAFRMTRRALPAGILATEVGLLIAALRPAPRPSPDGFTMHRTATYGPVVAGLIMAIAVESVAVHFLVRIWSHTAAWALTASSIYAFLWLVGDARAIAQRTTTFTRDTLRLRLGLRWSADVPLDQIETCSTWRGAPPKGSRAIALLGTPNVHLALKSPIDVKGVYGLRRRATQLFVRVDEPDEFVAVIARPSAAN